MASITIYLLYHPHMGATLGLSENCRFLAATLDKDLFYASVSRAQATLPNVLGCEPCVILENTKIE